MTWLRHVAGRTLWLVAGLVLATAVWRAFAPASPADTRDQAWQAVADKYRFGIRYLSGQLTAVQQASRRATEAYRLVIARRDTAIANYQAEVRRLPEGTPGREVAVLETKCAAAMTESAHVNDVCQERIAAAQQEAALYHALYQTAAPRLAQADTLIAANVRASQCKILFVHCPSRIAMGEFALLVGTVFGWVLHH